MTTFEEEYGVLAVGKVIARFKEKYPNADLTKVQLEFQGPFLKYDLVGQDDQNVYTLDINAQTGDLIKENEKLIKPKQQDRRERKALNLENMLPLEEINRIALDNVQVDNPFQWEMDRKGERTLWKVEVANNQGGQVTEVKIDAQDGTVTQVKLKE